jgi:pilus assembly protein Flp/PilA
MHALFASLYVLGADIKDRFRNEDRGATAVEYGLLVGLIAVVIIVAVIALGGKLNGLFESVDSKLPAGGTGSTAPTSS